MFPIFYADLSSFASTPRGIDELHRNMDCTMHRSLFCYTCLHVVEQTTCVVLAAGVLHLQSSFSGVRRICF